jgi:copper homeostasis protein (lipoprotein)
MPVLTQGAGRELTLVLRVIGAPRPALVGGPLGAPFPKLPASFSGDLPCADCVALRYRLNLFADGSYVLGTKYVGRNDDLLYDLGRWSLAGDRLTLRGGREAPELLQVIDSRTLRKLDRDGRPVDSAHNATLVRTAQFEPLQPRLFMRGLYRHSADAATFSECLSGQTWPVAAIAEHGTLERETLKVRKQPGAPVVVSLDGHVAPRARSDGKGTQPTLVVERFVRAWPDQTCAPFGRVGPTDIDWTLIALDGSAIAASAGASGAPLLRLNSAGSTVTGFGGCNRLRGSYTLAGDALSFGLMASTRMACAAGMPEEQAFVDMLSRAGRWRLDDGQLVLVDAGGREIARFKAAASR